MEDPNNLGLGRTAPDGSPSRDTLGTVDIEDFLRRLKVIHNSYQCEVKRTSMYSVFLY